MLHVLFPFGDRIMGTCAMKWYKRITRMSQWSNLEIREWQEKELQKFVKHAYEHTVYYRNLFDSLGLTPEDIHDKRDLVKIPVITKEIVNENYNSLIPDNLSSFNYRLRNLLLKVRKR